MVAISHGDNGLGDPIQARKVPLYSASILKISLNDPIIYPTICPGHKVPDAAKEMADNKNDEEIHQNTVHAWVPPNHVVYGGPYRVLGSYWFRWS